jgi:hypothetical protein
MVPTRKAGQAHDGSVLTKIDSGLAFGPFLSHSSRQTTSTVIEGDAESEAMKVWCLP